MKPWHIYLAIITFLILWATGVFVFIPALRLSQRIGSVGYIEIQMPGGSSGNGGSPSDGGGETLESLLVYTDESKTTELKSINWGTVEPGSHNHYPAFLLNPSEVNIRVDLATENWKPPEASKYMVLTWDSNGDLAKLTDSPVSFALKVGSEIVNAEPQIREFSFDIILTVSAV